MSRRQKEDFRLYSEDMKKQDDGKHKKIAVQDGKMSRAAFILLLFGCLSVFSHEICEYTACNRQDQPKNDCDGSKGGKLGEQSCIVKDRKGRSQDQAENSTVGLDSEGFK